jgi:DNA-binding transcriptional MerR regulator
MARPNENAMKNGKIPDKLVYKMDEVSRIAQLDPKTIDGWEKEFPFIHAGQTAQGVKVFRQKDLQIIIRLKELLVHHKLTLAGAKRRIEEEFGLVSAEAIHPDRLKKVLYRVREELLEISQTLEKKAKKY